MGVIGGKNYIVFGINGSEGNLWSSLAHYNGMHVVFCSAYLLSEYRTLSASPVLQRKSFINILQKDERSRVTYYKTCIMIETSSVQQAIQNVYHVPAALWKASLLFRDKIRVSPKIVKEGF